MVVYTPEEQQTNTEAEEMDQQKSIGDLQKLGFYQMHESLKYCTKKNINFSNLQEYIEDVTLHTQI